jgi:hypothetical protein
MKQQIPKIVKSVLLGVCFIFLLFIVIPGNTKIPAMTSATGAQAVTIPSIDDIITDTGKMDQGYIAEMFGWIRPTVPPPPVPTAIPTKPPAPTCIPAGFLKFITTFRDEKDVVWYIFKDLKNGSQVKVSKGIPDQGWELMTETDTYFTFRKNGEINCVPR